MSKKVLGQKFRVQKLFGPKIFWVQTNLASNKFWGQKMLVHQNLIKSILGTILIQRRYALLVQTLHRQKDTTQTGTQIQQQPWPPLEIEVRQVGLESWGWSMLTDISAISQVYLRHISCISHVYIRHIPGLSQSYHKLISGICQQYLIKI